MKRLRYLGLMAAIGALAILAHPHPASAAGATPRDLPRPSGTTGTFAASAGNHSNHTSRPPAGKPVSHHQSRPASRPSTRHSHARGKSGSKSALPVRNFEMRTHVNESGVISLTTPFHRRIDDPVRSGRGPPSAGTTFSVSRDPLASRPAVPCPASEPQVVSFFPRVSSPQRTQVFAVHSPGPIRPGRAVRREGTAARQMMPSFGGVS